MPGVGTCGRVHRHVQEHRAPAPMRLASQFGGMRSVREDGQGYGGRQVEDAPVAFEVLSQIVDDDAE
ncbi:hypothetical protein D9M71_542780 [compost metagenome]